MLKDLIMLYPFLTALVTALVFVLSIVFVPTWYYWNRCAHCHKKIAPLKERPAEWGEFAKCNHCGAVK